MCVIGPSSVNSWSQSPGSPLHNTGANTSGVASAVKLREAAGAEVGAGDETISSHSPFAFQAYLGFAFSFY
jgi:hypothetical protein